MIQRFTLLFITSLFFVGLAGCNGEDISPEEQAEIDLVLINDYIAENNLEGEFIGDDIFLSFVKEGRGTEKPNSRSVAEVVFKGRLLDGTQFTTTNGLPERFFVGNFIPGFQLALAEMTPGSKTISVIPSRMAYATRSEGIIPPNSVLIFEVELIDFE